jgi:hypothetical protein
MKKIIYLTIFVLFSVNSIADNIISEASSYTILNYLENNQNINISNFYSDSSNIIRINDKYPTIDHNYIEYLNSLKIYKDSVPLTNFDFDILLIMARNQQVDTIAIDISGGTLLFRNREYLYDINLFLKFSGIIPRFIIDYYIYIKSILR